MNKRGPVIAVIGTILIVSSLLVASSIIPNFNTTMGGQFLIPDLLEGIFDYVSEERQIFPGQTTSFSYSTSQSDVPLLWGIQASDYQPGDKFSVTITDIFGDDLGTFENDGVAAFNIFEIPENNIYNFEVENLGNRPITVISMFAEDPDNSEALSDPNSPLMSTIIPLAVSGILMIFGIIVIIIGTIISIMDWRRESNRSKYI